MEANGVKGHEVVEGGIEGPNFFSNDSLTLLSGVSQAGELESGTLTQLWGNPRDRQLCSWPDRFSSSVFLEYRKSQAGSSSLRSVLVAECHFDEKTSFPASH